MKRLLLTLIVVLFICPAANAEMYFIQEVVNGNTLRLLSGETVRLIGVDIPEMRPDMSLQERQRVTNNRLEAAAYVRSLVSGAKADLQFDVKERDEEGNILAYAWFLYPEANVKEALEFKDDYRVDDIVEDWGDHKYVAFLNAAVIKSGYGVYSNSDSENAEHSELLASVYQQRSVPTMQVKKEEAIDLTRASK